MDNAEVSMKQDEQVGKLVAPVFREVPPNSKAGKFLTEGFRSWAFIAISAIADEISTTTLKIYKRESAGWTEVENNPALQLMEKPNSFQTKEEFFWLASIYWLAEGEAPIYLNSLKNPTEMVLLNPERLSVVFDNKNIIGGYKYRQTGGGETKIPAENIIMLKMPSVHSPFRGAGVMRYISQTLDIDNYIEEYLKLFFFNDTTPGAVLESDHEMSDNIIKRLKQQFVNRHQGIRNSHKLAVLEKGLKYHKISSNINELQLKELNDITRDKVLASFKVPKSVLGIVEDVNRSSAETSDYTFSKRAVLPKLKMIEGQLNQFLLPKFTGGDMLWFEFESPVFEDKKQNAEIYAMAIQNGWMTVDEVREEQGLDPLGMDDEEENTHGQDETLGKFAKPKEVKIAKGKKRPDALTAIMKDILDSETPTIKKEWSRDELEVFHSEKIMFTEFIERDFIDDLKKNFRRQERKLLKQIEGKSVKENGINLQLDMEEEVKEMIRITNPYLYDAIVKESALTYRLLGLQNTLRATDDLVKDFVSKRTVKLGTEASKTTQDAVDKIVKDWTETGGAWTELRDSLREYFDAEGDSGAKARANTIARTELSNATGFAQQEVYKDTGAVGKKWLTATDERVCEMCASMEDKNGNGMTVGISENFFDKGAVLPNGAINSWEPVETPPLHPNCRCDIIPVYEQSKINRDSFTKVFEAKRDEIEAEEKRLSDIKAKESEIQAKELSLIEKEEKIAKAEAKVKADKAKAKKAKDIAKKELEDIDAVK